MPHSPLRILLVEDNEDDASLILRALRRGGYAPFWQRVETAEALDRALADHRWDIVLCDCVLPQFNGVSAARRVRGCTTGVPVVMVSGERDEEMALAGMQAGAAAYVRKDRLAQLAAVVRQHLERLPEV